MCMSMLHAHIPIPYTPTHPTRTKPGPEERGWSADGGEGQSGEGGGETQ